MKTRSSRHHFTWHQDSTYSKFGDDGVTVWLAFSRVQANSGPLLFRRSSHLLGQLPHVESEDESNLLAFGQYIPDNYRNQTTGTSWSSSEIVAAELQPGEASAHNFLTIHSSSPNQDSVDRVGLAVRLVKAAAGVGRRDRVTRLCGNGDLYDFEMEEVPQTEFGQKELVEWHKSLDREKAMYFADRPQSNYK